MKIINGVAVMIPPEDNEDVLQETFVQPVTIVEKHDDIVTMQLEGRDTDDVQAAVHNQSTEEQSNNLAAQVRAENAANAEAAHVVLTPKKIGNTIVTAAATYDDLDLDVLAVDRTKKNVVEVEEEENTFEYTNDVEESEELIQVELEEETDSNEETTFSRTNIFEKDGSAN